MAADVQALRSMYKRPCPGRRCLVPKSVLLMWPERKLGADEGGEAGLPAGCPCAPREFANADAGRGLKAEGEGETPLMSSHGEA